MKAEKEVAAAKAAAQARWDKERTFQAHPGGGGELRPPNRHLDGESEVLGVECTPATWMQDQFTTMRMVYKDLSGRRVLMHENTKISAVYASRTLEVSMSR